MKRLILIFSLLCFALYSEGQVIRASGSYVAPVSGGGGGYCDEYQAVYDEFTNKPNGTYAGYQNTMVEALVDGGYWTRILAFWVPSITNNGAGEADINWKNVALYTLVETGEGSLTWTANEGYTGDGTNYLDAQFNPHDNGASQNSLTFFTYLRVDESAGNYCVMGCEDATAMSLIMPGIAGTTGYYAIGQAGNTSGTNDGHTYGLFMVTRRGATEVEVYQNGGSIGTGSDASTELSDQPLFLLAHNYLGNPYYISSNQISIAGVINAVSDGEALAISNILNAYMTSLSKNVY